MRTAGTIFNYIQISALFSSSIFAYKQSGSRGSGGANNNSGIGGLGGRQPRSDQACAIAKTAIEKTVALSAQALNGIAGTFD
ncbi:MAG: hypothetical protein ACI9WS_001312 [Paraglaciecola psychrophila]